VNRLRCETPVTLVGGGPVTAQDLAAALKFAPLLIGADGGANEAKALGYEAAHVIGDMDSVDLQTLGAATKLHPIAEQMSTDLDKCLYSTAAPFYIGLGFLGGRLDHELAALHAMVRAKDQKLVLVGETDLCFLAPETLVLDLPTGTRLSLFPMGSVTATSKGIRYPLDDYLFDPAAMIGTSNTVTGPVQMQFDARLMLVILPKAYLNAVITQVFAV